MNIQCKLIREGGTRAEVFGVEYHFIPQEDGSHVAVVENDAHVERFLSIPEAYGIYKGAAEVKTADPVKLFEPKIAPKVEDEPDIELAGSDEHPESFEINGSTYTLQQIVRIAYDESGMDAAEWNELTPESRAARLDTVLDNIADAANDPTIDELRAAYKEKFGKNPHPSAKAETLKARLEEGIE